MKFIFNIINAHRLYIANLCSTFISQSINAISILILTPILTKEMGLLNFGIYGVILNIVAFSAILDFGFNIGLLRRYIHLPNDSSKLVNSLLVFYITLLVVLAPIFYFIYTSLIHLETKHYFLLAVLTALLIFQNIVSVFFDTLIQSLNLLYVCKLIRAAKLIVESLIILIYINQISLIKVLFITVSVNIVYLLTLYYYVNKKLNFKINFRFFSFNEIADHFKYCFWYFLSSLATVLIFNTQIFVIHNLLGSIQAAKFLVITKFYDIIRMAISNFTQILFPKIIKIEVEKNWVKIKELFIKLLTRIAIMVVFIVLFIYWLGPYVFIKWSKIQDNQTLITFKLFAFLIGFIIIDNVSVIFLNALKLNKTPTIVSIIQGILGIILSYIFVRQFNIVGVVYAAGISFIITNMIFNPTYLLKKLNAKIIEPS